LYSFNSIDVAAGIWCPCCSSILKDRPYQTFVTINFDINKSVFKVPLKKTFDFIGFTGDLLYMIVPGKMLVYRDA